MKKKLIAAVAAVAAVGTAAFMIKKKRSAAKIEPAGRKKVQKHKTDAFSKAKNYKGAKKTELDII